jgi:hypothetical protein
MAEKPPPPIGMPPPSDGDSRHALKCRRFFLIVFADGCAASSLSETLAFSPFRPQPKLASPSSSGSAPSCSSPPCWSSSPSRSSQPRGALTLILALEHVGEAGIAGFDGLGLQVPVAIGGVDQLNHLLDPDFDPLAAEGAEKFFWRNVRSDEGAAGGLGSLAGARALGPPLWRRVFLRTNREAAGAAVLAWFSWWLLPGQRAFYGPDARGRPEQPGVEPAWKTGRDAFNSRSPLASTLAPGHNSAVRSAPPSASVESIPKRNTFMRTDPHLSQKATTVGQSSLLARSPLLV